MIQTTEQNLILALDMAGIIDKDKYDDGSKDDQETQIKIDSFIQTLKSLEGES